MIDQRAIIGHPPQHREYRDKPEEWFPPEIAETARIEALAIVECGVQRATMIGERTWLMSRCHIGHDTMIGADCEIGVGVIIAGHCRVGDRARFGVGSMVYPGRKIGDGAKIGIGAVVLNDVPAGATVFGNPARIFKRDAVAA